MMFFADDTKLYREIKNDSDDQIKLQEDIDNMQKWSDKWLLLFHPDKCKIMRLGVKDRCPFTYSINNQDIEYTVKEKDLDVTIDDKLNFESHISTKVQTANNIMGLIRRTFTYLDKTIFTRLFKALVRPHLEYAHTVWHPSQIKLKKIVENVLRRATKMLPCCSDLSYTERLQKLDLPCMAYRKLRGDIIEVYKMANGHYDVDIPPPINLKNDCTMQTRSSGVKLCKSNIKRASRANFFKNRVVSFGMNCQQKSQKPHQ